LFFSTWWDAFTFDTTVARELEAVVNELHLKVNKFVPRSDRRHVLHRIARPYEMLISSLDVEHVRWTGVADRDADRMPSDQHLADMGELPSGFSPSSRSPPCSGPSTATTTGRSGRPP
jgi:hypothetical protein